ncbi:hypothetical protein [Staphylococcus pasteuri]|uniref:hypothetical protein n=1 Tax=Staphylococcus pasteuri TaxID=45972 RepID=UPI00249B6AC7|nr:hypothetical protein [Staphylococcus pasteuri]MDI3233347.1 hypothetical protein [Staphylococcus pasteuri]
MEIYLFDAPTKKQLEYAEYLQSFLQDDRDLTKLNKKELSDYIDSIKTDVEYIVDELQSHTDILW